MSLAKSTSVACVQMPDIDCHLTSGTAQVRDALDRIRSAFDAAGVAKSRSISAEIVLAEVLNNVVEHAYLFAESRPIDVVIWIRENGLWCEVSDEGVEMPGGQVPVGMMPTLDPGDPSSLPEGGFGWAMVRSMTRDLEYIREAGRNHLRFFVPD